MNVAKKYDSIDFFKGICCIACVFIHYNFPGELGIAVKTVCRIAVPFFFFVSGYFFLNKDNVITKERLKSKINHILKMLFYSGIFYAIFCVIGYKVMSKSWTISNFVAQRIDLGSITKFFITNDPFVYAHLWFLLALLYCYLLMIPFRNKIFPKSYLFIYLFIYYVTYGLFFICRI